MNNKSTVGPVVRRADSEQGRLAGIWRKLRPGASADEGFERWRRIFVSLGGALFARILAFLCNLLLIPLALRFLGPENYGIWVTLTGSVMLLTFLDFGVGIGLQNKVAGLLGSGRLEETGYYLRSTLALLLLAVSALFLVATLVILKTTVPLRLFRDPHFAQLDPSSLLLVVFGAFMLSLPLGLFSRMAYGLQQGWIASVASALGAGLSLLAVFLATRFGASFRAFVAVTVLVPLLAQAMVLGLLRRHVPGGISLLGPISFRDGLTILRQGSHYVLPQIAGAIVTQGPLVFLGLLSSPLDAATYSILLRIGTPVQQVQQLFLVQVWPAITEARHRGDVGWLRKALPRVFKLNLVFGVASTIIISVAVLLLFPALAKNRSIQPTNTVVLLYAASVGIMCVVQGLAYIGNGLARLAMQNWLAVVSIVFAFTALPAVAAARGIAGTLSAFIALNCLFSIPLLYHEYRSFLRRQLARDEGRDLGPNPRTTAAECRLL